MNLYEKASLIITPNAYKAGKIYAAKPTSGDGDLTFSRASVANRTNSVSVLESMASGVPRIEYPVGGGCPSILLEPQRTNIVPYSIDFANAAYTKLAGAAITANATISPDGTNNASLLSVGTSAFSGIYIGITGASGKYSNCIYAKKGTYNFVYFVDITGSTVTAWFNLNAGSVGTVVSGYSAKITASINGFYKCEVTRTGANQVPTYFQIGASSADNTNGGSTGNIYIYQAQTELGGYSTSPILTAGSSVTRIADSYSLTFAAKPIGTFFIQLINNIPLPSDGIHLFGPFTLDVGGGGLGLVSGRANNARVRIWTRAGSSIYATTSDSCKLAITFDGTYINIWENGVKVVTNYAYAMTNVTKLYSYSSLETSQNISLIELYDSILTNTECIALTTL